ncbi:MAG: hypothetical protein ACLRTQ_07860 [Candidatus Borkfalkia sp.]
MAYSNSEAIFRPPRAPCCPSKAGIHGKHRGFMPARKSGAAHDRLFFRTRRTRFFQFFVISRELQQIFARHFREKFLKSVEIEGYALARAHFMVKAALRAHILIGCKFVAQNDLLALFALCGEFFGNRGRSGLPVPFQLVFRFFEEKLFNIFEFHVTNSLSAGLFSSFSEIYPGNWCSTRRS